MPEGTPNSGDAEQREPSSTPPSAPATGRRAAFQDIKRQLTEEDLKSPGTQKLLLDMLLTTETERDDHKTYIDKFHAADKRVSVLEEQSKRNKINETLFVVGVGVGGTIIGLAPTLWSHENLNGPICLGVGIILVVGATLGRILFR